MKFMSFPRFFCLVAIATTTFILFSRQTEGQSSDLEEKSALEEVMWDRNLVKGFKKGSKNDKKKPRKIQMEPLKISAYLFPSL